MSKKKGGGGGSSTRESRVAEPVVAAFAVKVSASLLFFFQSSFARLFPVFFPLSGTSPTHRPSPLRSLKSACVGTGPAGGGEKKGDGSLRE